MTKVEQELFGLADSIDEHCSALGVSNGKLAAALCVCIARLIVQRTITRKETEGSRVLMALDCTIGTHECIGMLKDSVKHYFHEGVR